MTERVQKEVLVHIPVLDLADELDEQGKFKALTPLAVWFDKSGDLVVEFEGIVDD